MTKDTDSGKQPAFPYILTDDQNVSDTDFQPGLTKREYFAAMAMLGLIANTGGVSGARGETYHDATAKESILLADALLTQLNQNK